MGTLGCRRGGVGVGRETALPRSQLGGVQDAVFAFPLNEWLGVPLSLAPQQGCVALVHSCALRLHLEGDENWMGRAQQGQEAVSNGAGRVQTVAL